MKKLLSLVILGACATTQSPELKPQKPTYNPEVITKIVGDSTCKGVSWKERGRAPLGYIKGMALLYAKHACSPNETTKHFNGAATKNRTDIFGYYPKQSMRDLFTLMISSGMWESSGKYFVGKDRSAQFNTENSCEAGLFQTSYGASSSDTYMKTMLEYKDDCLLDVFKEGVRAPDAANLENFGNPNTPGYKYQKLSKACPAFHSEFSFIAARKNAREFGPLRSGKLEFKQECSDMLAQVDEYLKTVQCN